jgi:hypothetical protein
MSQGIKMRKKQKRGKNRKGLSIMVGYVLLVSLAIIMGGIIYAWMKSYVPRDPLECPDGTSLMIKNYHYNCSDFTLNISLKNNGRFDIGGFFIHASDNSSITLPTIDVSPTINVSASEKILIKYPSTNSIIFSGEGDNSLKPGDEIATVLLELSGIGRIYYLQIIPTRWQEQENVLRYVSCGDVSIVREDLSCAS